MAASDQENQPSRENRPSRSQATGLADPQAREELTAYLDGELDPAASRRVEERLKHDTAYRQELERLEQAWRMLDELDRAVTGEQFTRTTLEMVAAAATQERSVTASWPPLAIVSGLVLLLATAGIGWACGRWIWPDPNTQLLHEMPVLESIDLYDQGESIEFVRKLERGGLFDQAPDQAAAAAPIAELSPEEEIDQRRDEIERMTPAERQHLRRKQDHFARYSLAERQRMLRLYDDLDRDPHEQELRRVLSAYHEWLDTLALSVRAELADLAIDDRLAKVQQLKQQQEAQRQQELQEAPSEQDLQAILRWNEELGWEHREALLASLSPERRKYLEGLGEDKQRRAMLWLEFHQWHLGKRTELPVWDEPALAELNKRLSAGAKHRLAALGAEEKRKMIFTWLQTAIRHRMETGGIRQLLPPIEQRELGRFARDELSANQQEALLPLSRDQKHRLLLRIYFMPSDRLASLNPSQMQGFPQLLNPDKQRPARTKPGKRLKAKAEQRAASHPPAAKAEPGK